MGATAATSRVVNGWSIFIHPLFLSQLETLTGRVEALKRKDPQGYAKNNAIKRLSAIQKLAFEAIPQGPTQSDYRQGGTLGDEYKHWFRAKFFSNTVFSFATTCGPKSLCWRGSTTKTPSGPTRAATTRAGCFAKCWKVGIRRTIGMRCCGRQRWRTESVESTDNRSWGTAAGTPRRCGLSVQPTGNARVCAGSACTATGCAGAAVATASNSGTWVAASGVGALRPTGLQRP